MTHAHDDERLMRFSRKEIRPNIFTNVASCLDCPQFVRTRRDVSAKHWEKHALTREQVNKLSRQEHQAARSCCG